MRPWARSGGARTARGRRRWPQPSRGGRWGPVRLFMQVWALSRTESNKVVQPRVPVAGRADRFSPLSRGRKTCVFFPAPPSFAAMLRASGVCRHRTASQATEERAGQSGQGSIAETRRQKGKAAPAPPASPNRERPPEPKRYKAEQGRAARILPPDAAHPPLRGARRPALRARPDRRLLPPLYRPGGGRGRAAVGAGGGQGQRHHRLSRPWPHARLRHRSQGDHGRADRPRRRHQPRQGRIDAHVQRRAPLLRRPRHRRRPGQPRHRACVQAQICGRRRRLPRLFRRRRGQSGPGLREPSTWPSCGSCRSSS